MWDETLHLLNELFDDVWEDGSSIDIKDWTLDLAGPVRIFSLPLLSFSTHPCTTVDAFHYFCGRYIAISCASFRTDGISGFGKRLSWKGEAKPPPGFNLTFHQALHIVDRDVLWMLALPKWLLGIIPRFKSIKYAMEELPVSVHSYHSQ